MSIEETSFVERMITGHYVVTDGERRLVLPPDTSPEDLTREIVNFVPSLKVSEPGIVERLASVLWPFGR